MWAFQPVGMLKHSASRARCVPRHERRIDGADRDPAIHVGWSRASNVPRPHRPGRHQARLPPLRTSTQHGHRTGYVPRSWCRTSSYRKKVKAEARCCAESRLARRICRARNRAPNHGACPLSQASRKIRSSTAELSFVSVHRRPVLGGCLRKLFGRLGEPFDGG